ncbi:NPC intracellular cholesterol transporter 2 homolog a-like [Osmia bicornis bicornis]|uniref:NPC intracellular cholesterol transporter 2 homolog a-like n=1 Tax=Osmia bicornis bicornis TaxID=1437191 RepID=UPI0010F6ADD6|nr:NPC intracellular cholesterol transporter 2 homolog a-like [Osmia bicornis bicornis]
MCRTIAAILFLCSLSSTLICRAFDVEDCGSKVGKFTSVSLGCDMNKAACELIHDTNATIVLNFVVDKDVSKVTAVVHGIIMDIPVPFPLADANACDTADSGLTCPLAKGGSFQYKNTLPIHKSYPKMSVTVKWELKDENNEDIVCVLIPAKIK